MANRYGYHSTGDPKKWFIYDYKLFSLVPGLRFKTKREAIKETETLNQKEVRNESNANK
jgi:hypothetical protein